MLLALLLQSVEYQADAEELLSAELLTFKEWVAYRVIGMEPLQQASIALASSNLKCQGLTMFFAPCTRN